jgi:hypothetical protein
MTTMTTTKSAVTVAPKKVDPSKFAHGYSLMSESQWLVLIATEHCRIKYPGFYPLCPELTFEQIEASDLSESQLTYCNEYWNNVLAGPSEGALAARRALTRGSKVSYCNELDSGIFIIEWDAENNRAKRGTGHWLSYRGTKPSFRFGITPKSGKIGGHAVEDTHRNKFSQITVRSLTALIEEIMSIKDCDNETAKKIFNLGRQPKGFFVSHGHGLWSGTHPSVVNPSQADIERATVELTAQKANRKPKTHVQIKLWTLFGTMPPKHVNDIAAWLIEDADRVVILTEFQAASPSESIREMSLEDYAYYKWRNLCNTVRDDNMVPVIQVGRSRWQGKQYVEPPEVTAAKAKSAEKDRQYEQDMADMMKMVCPVEPREAVENSTKSEDCSATDLDLAENSTNPQPEYQGYDDERTPEMTDDQHFLWMAARDKRLDAEEAVAVKETERREQARRWHETVKKWAAEKQKQKPVKRRAGDCPL